jgi:hypothetical protein
LYYLTWLPNGAVQWSVLLLPSFFPGWNLLLGTGCSNWSFSSRWALRGTLAMRFVWIGSPLRPYLEGPLFFNHVPKENEGSFSLGDTYPGLSWNTKSFVK